jgi:hypothetical protein
MSALPDSASSGLTPVVIGLMIGGAISWVVVRRALREPNAAGTDGGQVTADERRTIWQVVAAIYATLTFVALAAAIVVGDAAALVLAIVAFGVGLLAVLRLGLPRDHPAWRWVAATIWRR